MSNIVAVIGATGIQGGSVVSTLLKDGIYKVRGITRNANSPKAHNLTVKGVEMVEADLDNEASLVEAFSVSHSISYSNSASCNSNYQGVYAIYAVTDFFEPFGKHGPVVAVDIEVAQGKALANAAAKTATLKHYIWSTLPNGKQLSGGKHIIPHFEGKNIIDAYIKSISDLLAKTTFLWNTYYASNLLFPLFTPNLVKTTGKYVWLQPTPADTEITILGDANTNVGPFVSGILRRPDLTLPAKFVLATTGEKLTQNEILQAWGRATGRDVEYVEISLKDFDRLWPKWGLEMGTMLKMWEDLKENSWGGEKVVTKEDLGINQPLIGIEEWFKFADWPL